MTSLADLSRAQVAMLTQASDGFHVTADAAMPREDLTVIDSLLRLGLLQLHEEGEAIRFRLTAEGRRAHEDGIDQALGNRRG